MMKRENFRGEREGKEKKKNRPTKNAKEEAKRECLEKPGKSKCHKCGKIGHYTREAELPAP